jgi:hypothetical protein
VHAPGLVHMACRVLLVSSVLLGGTAHTAEPTRPFRVMILWLLAIFYTAGEVWNTRNSYVVDR